MVEMRVEQLTTDPTSNRQMVWLRSVEDHMMVPIMIGYTESQSIYSEIAGRQPPRPLTHDLFRTVLDHFDAEVEEVHIVDLKDGIFYAELVLSFKGKELRLDARPSDSIALALKYDAPIYMAEKVIKKAGFKPKPEDGEAEPELDLSESEGRIPTVGSVSSQDMEMAVEDLLDEIGVAESEALSGGEADLQEQIHVLKKWMEQAIKEERYEEASQIRDRIAKIEGEREDP